MYCLFFFPPTNHKHPFPFNYSSFRTKTAKQVLSAHSATTVTIQRRGVPWPTTLARLISASFPHSSWWPTNPNRKASRKEPFPWVSVPATATATPSAETVSSAGSATGATSFPDATAFWTTKGNLKHPRPCVLPIFVCWPSTMPVTKSTT